MAAQTTASPVDENFRKPTVTGQGNVWKPGEPLDSLQRGRLDDDGCCLCLNQVSALHMIKEHTASINGQKRKVCLVYINRVAYWADRITGSLYDLKGKCKSSSYLFMDRMPS